MRLRHALPFALLLAGSSVAASAADVPLVDSDHKKNCKFMSFVDFSKPTREAAMAEITRQTKHYGGDSFYLMSETDNGAKGYAISGQAIKCN